MNLQEQFVLYELALELKNLGFDEECLAYWYAGGNELIYNPIPKYELEKYKLGFGAPIWQQAFEWFGNKGYYSYIEPVIVEGAASRIKFDYVILSEKGAEEEYNNKPYHTIYEGRVACLTKLIEIIDGSG